MTFASISLAFAQGVPVKEPQIQIVATFPNGTFLENIDVATSGDVYFTSYFEQAIYRYGANEKAERFAAVPIHPASVLVTKTGFIAAGPTIPFTKGAEFTATNQLLLLRPDGSVEAAIPAPEAKFLNGMTRLSDDDILSADSIAGAIWRFNVPSRQISEWLRHEWLTQDPANKQFVPGANGIKIAGNTAYVSNSSRGAIYAVKLDATGKPAGALTLFAKTGPVDDFAILPDDSIVAATHGETLLRIMPDGKVSNLVSRGCGGCTAVGVRPVQGGTDLFVTTTGSLLEGGKEPAHLLRIPMRE